MAENTAQHASENVETGKAPRPRRWKRIVFAAFALSLIAAGLYYGVPWFKNYLNSVSTDDAYISGYVTYIGPRIASRVEKVAVNEDDFIYAGEVLIWLDPQPFQLAVEQAKANLLFAQANLAQARTGVRSQLSASRANQYLAQSALNQVQFQIANLRSAIAQLKLDKAQLLLAEENFQREARLLKLHAVTQEDYDQSQATMQVARDTVDSQAEIVQRIRADLGLPRNTENPGDVPDDIRHTYPQVQVALANWATSLIQVGVELKVIGLSPEALDNELQQWLNNNSSETIEALVEAAPSVRVSLASVHQAQAALDKAELDLSYTEIKSPFDGFVTKRTVNPGDYVAPGQNLLAIQSLSDVWVDANFKETAINYLRIGMPVNVYVDAYPGKKFSGRVAGFSPATGARLSLLPPENATGNFVKVVQRLPVRIEFDEPPSPQTPLFIGLSVEPYVRFKAKPTGPHAGMRLRLPESGERVSAARKSGQSPEFDRATNADNVPDTSAIPPLTTEPKSGRQP
jgi:membrane fusion protein (multidrug efflux system)